ncbi:MAG TPA: AAA family ATPase [Candidatus Baltobacteraceae bacterium]|nr:AAA family ATPase [Candidatus Baltobacteraceae bacterium]
MGTPQAAALIGRADELDKIREYCRALAAGNGALVLLDGDAGAGKTRLLHEILKPPFLPRGYVAISSGALDYARAPYAPIRDVLVALDKLYPKVLANDTALAQRLRPVLDFTPLEHAGDDGAARRRLLDAFVGALHKYAANAPLVLAVEDVHWIDRASADVLMHTARDLSVLRALVLVTYRGSEAGERPESRDLIAQLSRSAAKLQIKPLSTSDAMLLIQDVVPSNLPIGVRRTICELGQGNPLLLIELARHAADNPDSLNGTLPVSLQSLVNDRLARFDERDRDLLRVCAAMDAFEPAAVAEIAQAPVSAVMATLRKARTAGIVVEAPGSREKFLFRHALIRRAITGELLVIEIAALHARIARRLEAQELSNERNARLAYHYWMAGERENSRRFNALAAQAAAAVYAYDDAAMLYERAVEGALLDETSHALHVELAQTYVAAGRYRQAMETYRRLFLYAREHISPNEAARIAIDLSRCCYHALDDEGATSALSDALAILDERANPELAFELHGLLGWYAVHRRQLEEADAALQRAETLLQHGSAVPRVRFHEARAAHEVHAKGGGAWREHLERALDTARRLEPKEQVRRFLNAIALSVASEIDAFDYALDLIAELKGIVASNAGLDHESYLDTAAWITFTCGRLVETRELIDALLPYVNDAPIYGFRVASVGIPLGLRTGDDLLLHACMRPRVLHDAFASKREQVFGPVATAVAEHMLAQGRSSEAAALIERTMHRLTETGNNFDLLIMAARTGSDEVAKRAEQLLAPWQERSRSGRACMMMVRAYRCKSARRVEYAQDAARAFEDLRWPLHRAQALELAGEAEPALTVYRQCGAAAEVLRIERRMQGANGNGLSRREVEVAQLVAEGNSNRAIAERLVLSERTVENHIASIFTKLNVRSRVEIASFMTREKAQSAS